MATYFIVAVGIIALVALGWALGALILMVAWNVIAPIINAPTLEYGQAFAVWVIISLIGGAFRTVTSR